MTDSPQSSLPDDQRLDSLALSFWGSAGISARTALIIAAGAACLIFAVGANEFSLPILPGFDGSILAQPAPLVVLFLVALMLAGSAWLEPSSPGPFISRPGFSRPLSD